MKIGFNINYFLSWMGGRSFLAMIINAVKEIEGIEISLGLKVNTPQYNKISIDQIQYKNNEHLVAFCKATKTNELCIFNNIQTWFGNEKIDLLGPSYNNQNSSIPFINYLPDFQHKYIPDYFDDNELATRELQYANVLKNSSYCLVGDKTVAEDIARFYPWNKSKIFILPPFLCFQDKAIQTINLNKELREIEEDYVLVCSQRWQHKRHDLVLIAFANFLNSLSESERKNKKLVFTGDKTDYRTNSAGEVFQQILVNFNLTGHVVDLGIVERQRQLALIKNANALITASEFEGGIGASGVQEAMLLGTPVIAPRIPIFTQDFPVDINTCDFNNPIETTSIFENVFKKSLLVENSEKKLRAIFNSSIDEISTFLIEVSGKNLV